MKLSAFVAAAFAGAALAADITGGIMWNNVVRRANDMQILRAADHRSTSIICSMLDECGTNNWTIHIVSLPRLMRRHPFDLRSLRVAMTAPALLFNVGPPLSFTWYLPRFSCIFPKYGD